MAPTMMQACQYACTQVKLQVTLSETDLEHFQHTLVLVSQLTRQNLTVGQLTDKTGPQTERFSGLNIPDPRGRHVFNGTMNE